jgi:septal ring factor EnvC (AmiA/AmiB activator)
VKRARIYLLLLGLALGVSVASSTGPEEIKKRQAELQALRDQIRTFEQKIKQQQRNERSTLELLDSYDRKATTLGKLIRKLRSGEHELETAADQTRQDLQRLEDQLSFLKTHYAQYVASIYKSGPVYDLELLLSSRSINQLYIRAEYLKRFSTQRREDARKIEAKQREIEETQAELQQQLGEQRRLLAEKGAEEDRLATLMSDRRVILQGIRKDKRNIQREIDRKVKAAKELEDLVARLIEADRVRKAQQEEDIRAGRLPQPPPAVGTFASKRGKLRWPVSEGAVVARFGNQIHPTLKTITQNTGIDIAVPSGSPVNAVAQGEVSTIWWLPGYGNLVILNHYDGYRTVYAHLADINVTEGQKVNEGDLLGTSGETVDGPRVHFEVWKEREKQNPALWLSQR